MDIKQIKGMFITGLNYEILTTTDLESMITKKQKRVYISDRLGREKITIEMPEEKKETKTIKECFFYAHLIADESNNLYLTNRIDAGLFNNINKEVYLEKVMFDDKHFLYKINFYKEPVKIKKEELKINIYLKSLNVIYHIRSMYELIEKNSRDKYRKKIMIDLKKVILVDKKTEMTIKKYKISNEGHFVSDNPREIKDTLRFKDFKIVPENKYEALKKKITKTKALIKKKLDKELTKISLNSPKRVLTAVRVGNLSERYKTTMR